MDTSTPVVAATGHLQPIYPVLVKRIQSIFIDLIFILLVMFGISAIIDKFEQDVPDWLRGVLFLGLWFVYEPLSMSLGCTVGNYLIGIRVRKATDETKRINIFQSYIRFIIKLLLGWVSFLTVHTNPKRQAVHDIAAGSVMIQTQANLIKDIPHSLTKLPFMNKRNLLSIAAFLLLVLGIYMIYLGYGAGIKPPMITGVGFIIIAVAFWKLK